MESTTTKRPMAIDDATAGGRPSGWMDLWRYEKQAARNGFTRVAGVDEAGRGPLAGPVVAAAVILPPAFPDGRVIDSKKLSAAERERQYAIIYRHALSVGIGIVDAGEIDRINILRSSLAAMAVAVDNLQPQPDYLLVDGTFRVPRAVSQEAIPKGDALSVSIAAASIVAKVTRDRLMDMYHVYYPRYGFDRHRGYPTQKHREAIRSFGCSPIHRRTFRGVKEHLPQAHGKPPC
jgi:ribonuclease HII